MSESFRLASAVHPLSQGVFAWDVPDGWQQGRGAFGGLVLGAITRASESFLNDPSRPLRALLGEIFAPVTVGPAEIHVEILRRGRGLSATDARLLQSGEIKARASITFASDRPAVLPVVPRRAPVLPPWPTVVPLPVLPPVGPVFARHYLHRNTGPTLFAGGDDPVSEGWIHEVHPPAVLDAASLVGRMDAWWPSVYALTTAPQPAATVTFAMEFLTDPSSIPADGPLAYTARTMAAGGGFTVEFRELWSHGTCVALNQQTFAMLGGGA